MQENKYYIEAVHSLQLASKHMSSSYKLLKTLGKEEYLGNLLDYKLSIDNIVLDVLKNIVQE